MVILLMLAILFGAYSLPTEEQWGEEEAFKVQLIWDCEPIHCLQLRLAE